MLPRENRLNLSKEFHKFKRFGHSFKTPYFTLLWLKKQDQQPPRIGFVVSSKVGKAVVRNRIRRVLREVIRGEINSVPKSANFVLIGGKSILNADNIELKKELARSFERVK